MKKRIIALCTAAVLCLSLLSACGNGNGNEADGTPEEKQVDLAAFAQTLQENYEFSGFLERVDPADETMGELMTQMLENNYPGLAAMDLAQMEVYMSMISFSSGEFTLVQAKSAEDAAAAKDILQARIDSKSAEGMGNYPEEVEMWQRSARLVDHGTYVMMVCCDDADAIVDDFNALFS